ncbi:MAG: hypothetical protein OHK0012_08870 [Synechococcales cyanobacterium]
MDKETLEQFLNIPGIRGVALLSRQGRSFFQRSFATLDRRQQDALEEGLFQILDTMPPGFDFFDFQFAQQRIFVYPLSGESVLIVGVDDQQLVLAIYTEAVEKLRADLWADPVLATSVFRSLGQHREPTGTPKAKVERSQPTGIPHPVVLKAMNHLSEATHSYLGKAVVVNYWKASRSDVLNRAHELEEFLNQFEIDRSGEIRYGGPSKEFNIDQIKGIRAWVEAFIKRCEEVIRNFRSLLRTENLTPEERKLLLY